MLRLVPFGGKWVLYLNRIVFYKEISDIFTFQFEDVYRCCRGTLYFIYIAWERVKNNMPL